MAKFNSPATEKTKTVNLAGGEAFQESPELEFVSILLTSFVSDQFYTSADNKLDRLEELITAIKDKKFLAKAAIYARTVFGMRSITHAVAGELAKTVKGESWMKNFFEKVVYRPDDMTEILSYYLEKHKGSVPNSMKKGFAKAFGKFDLYSLAKYQARGKEVSLVDVVNLCHPIPNEKNAVALKLLVTDKLRSEGTWETALTQAGQKAKTEEEKEERKTAAWAELIKEGKLKYFALLRNLRNIAEQAPDVLEEALVQLVNEKAIKKSLVLPFRYMTAIEQFNETSVEGSRKIITALNKALDIAVSNVPKLPGRTLVALDVSGSMNGLPMNIAGLFAAVLLKANNADLIRFEGDASYQNYNPADSTLTLANSIKGSGGSTDFGTIFETANKSYDRIIILSDMQGWVGYDAPTREFAEYKDRCKANPKIYSFDLAGHGTLQLPERDVYCLAGFSEKIFDVMKLLEEDRQALINKIQAVVL